MSPFAALRSVIFWALLIGALSACGKTSSLGPEPMDGDQQETPELETEAEPDYADGDTDSDRTDTEPEDDALEAADGDPDADSADPAEQEFILIDGDTEEEIPLCDEVPPAKCFAQAPAGREGTACEGNLLLSCKPSTPTYPTCSSTCKCSPSQSCAERCLDSGFEGLAYCGSTETDGDLDETESDDDPAESGEADSDPDNVVETDTESVESETDSAESEEPPLCLPDAFENGGNDSFGARQPINWGNTPDLTLCPGDRDWYTLTLAPGDTLSVTLTISQGPRPVLVLFDANQNPLAQASSDGSDASGIVSLRYTSSEGGAVAIYTSGGYTTEAISYALNVALLTTTDGDLTDGTDGAETDSGENDGDAADSDGDSTEAESEADLDLAPVCLDDPAEPNDTCATSTLISLTPDQRYNVNNLTICPGNADWYTFAARSGETFSFRAYFDRIYGELDMNLMGPCDTPLSWAGTYQYFSDASGKGGIELSYRALNAGVFYLRIGAKDNPAIHTVYHISFLRQSAYTCGDEFDPNLTQGTAPSAIGSFPDLTLCKANDWFKYDLPAGQGLDFFTTFSSEAGNIDLTLYDSDGTTVLKRSNGTRNAERLIFNNASTTSKRLYVKVEAQQYGDFHYALTAKVGGPYCLEDNFEPNNAAGAAAQIAPDTYNGLMLCAGMAEEDWYQVALRDNWFVSAHFIYDRQTTPMQVMLYTPEQIQYGQQPQLYGSFVSDGATIDYSPNEGNGGPGSPVASPYYLRVRHTQNVVVPYSLALKVCEEDIYNNNTFEHAAFLPLDVPSNSSLTLCAGRQDWFYVELKGGETFKASIYYLVDLGDLDLYLYDSPTNEIAHSTTHTSMENVEIKAPPGAGTTYYLRVVGVGNAENGYNLTYTIN